jgi:c-di-GMP-binding flagellar brake protein YcgR
VRGHGSGVGLGLEFVGKEAMARTTGLTIRQHERASIELDAEFIVGAAHSAQVRFSSSSSAVNKATVRGIASDISPGGMGLLLEQFLPRGCEGTIRIYRKTAATEVDAAWRDVVFEHPVVVRRIFLGTHDPTYRIGMSFADPGPGLPQQVEALRAMAGATQ